MKKIIYVLILCFTSSSVFSQNIFNHECAVDLAPLLRSSNGFTLMYRYHAGKYSMRALANLYFENTTNGTNNDVTTPVGLNSSSATNATTTILNSEFRLGIQRNVSFENWGCYAGADAIFAESNNETNSETNSPGQFGNSRYTDKNSVTSISYGVAPVVGISYKMNTHFLISLENSFAFTYSQNSSNQTTNNYFTPVKGTEYLNNTNTSISSGGTTKFDFSPSKYLRIFIGFKF